MPLAFVKPHFDIETTTKKSITAYNNQLSLDIKQFMFWTKLGSV